MSWKLVCIVFLVALVGCTPAETIVITATPPVIDTPAPARMAEVDDHSSTPSFYASNLPTRTPVPTIPPLPTPNNDGISVYEPAITIDDFMLMNQDGEMVHLYDFAGQYVLLSFGYTHCPDICPLTLAHYKRIKTLLRDDAEKITFVFITVDIARDTPERLKEYIGLFDDSFVGLTAEDDLILRDVTSQYRVTYEVENRGGLLDEYPVIHSAGMYLMNPQGEWSRFYVYGTEPNVIARDLSGVLNG
ncbi:MAG: SCO family protein [Anaerolineae bacterium]|nr:SCO family protein [Anaerolineae bacterium]